MLSPWPNRTGDGTYTFDGVTYHLPITEAGRIDNTLISGQGGGADGIHYLRTTKQWVIEPSVFSTGYDEWRSPNR